MTTFSFFMLPDRETTGKRGALQSGQDLQARPVFAGVKPFGEQ
jgi:hypothetical protein